MRCIGVCIQDWQPSEELFESLLHLLDESAVKRIRAFKFKHDALANLVGRLLPLWELCTGDSSRTWNTIAQEKEAKGRPFLVDRISREHLPYDFNISHDGDMVVMASALSSLSSSSARLGIDVMRAALPVGIPSIPEFHATIEDMLTPKEKQAVDNAHLMDKLDLLLRFWISKEAMSKAIGEGLAFNYAELDSTIVRSGGNCTIRGAPCSARELSIHAGGAEYMVCVAVLGGRDVGDVPAEVEMISVERLVADILALSEKN